MAATVYTLGGALFIEFSSVDAGSDSERSLEDIVVGASLLSTSDAVRLAQTIAHHGRCARVASVHPPSLPMSEPAKQQGFACRHAALRVGEIEVVKPAAF